MFALMRPHFHDVGRQLQSVSLRYRHRAPTLGPWSRGARSSLLAGQTHESALGEGPTVRSQPLARLEAVLFLAREPLSSRRLARMANLADGTRARTLLRQLRSLYDARGSAFQVEEIAGGFQLLTRKKFAPWLRRLEISPTEVRLSQPALETLAVVAYRQPVLRADIEAVRGVACGEILRQLLERDLVRITGRAEELGRPFLYGTTKRFLQLFGLRHLEELPRAEMLRPGEASSESAVAKPEERSNDSGSQESTGCQTEEEEVTITERTTSEDEIRAGIDIAVLTDQLVDQDEDLDDDEEYEYEEEDDEYEDEFDDDDDEFEEFDDDDEFEDDDELEDDEFEDEEELEGDWEEVEDDDEEDEEEYEEDDEDWEEDDEDDWEYED